MEDDDNINSSNQFNDGSEENRIVQQFHRTNISGKKRQLYWYDIRNFPDSLLIEILARLPVKSIFLFKSVSKHWQTLISHPSFCQFYHSILNSNAALSRPFIILEKYICVPNFREFISRLRPEIHSSLEFSVLFLSSTNDPNDQYTVLDISNGLILCRWGWALQFVYYICDPFIGQWITLPTREARFQDILVEGLITRDSEDHMLTSYTVVSIERDRSQSNNLNIEMLSSETGKWIGYKLPTTLPIQSIEERVSVPIHCYGALHWQVRYNDEIHGINHGMLAFAPYKDPKSVRLIPLPRDRDRLSEYYNLGMCQLCGECQGTLRYFEVADDDHVADDDDYVADDDYMAADEDYLFSMWGMKDYEKGEWCCEFKVKRSDIQSNDPKLSEWLLQGYSFSPLSFHPLNPNVVYLTCMDPECVVSYDVLNKRLDVAFKPIEINECISSGLTVPFLLPRWPVLDSVTKTKLSVFNES